MRTANPALNNKTFSDLGIYSGSDIMTIQGTAQKAFVLLMLVLFSSVFVWRRFYFSYNITGDMSISSAAVTPFLFLGLIGGLIAALVTIFSKKSAPVTAPVYCLLEGLVIGSLSCFAEARFPGLVFQAVALTFGTAVTILFLYTSGWIKATEKFKMGIVSATGAIFLVYLSSFVLSFFKVNWLGSLFDSGAVGILFSLFVVSIAALNLVLDFDFIEKGAAAGAPKYMEWYGAFGLMVTLIWLYIEILRLLVKLQSRRR